MPKLTPEQRAEIKQRRQAGEPLRQLARDFGVSHTMVVRYAGRVHPEIAALNRAKGKRGPSNSERSLELRAARIRRDYMTPSDAAAELGISRYTVHEYLRDGKFPGAFQIGEKGRFWMIPRVSVEARKKPS